MTLRTPLLICLFVTLILLGAVPGMSHTTEDVETTHARECTLGPLPLDECSTGTHTNSHPFQSLTGFKAAGGSSFFGQVTAQHLYDNGGTYTQTCWVVASSGMTIYVPFTCEGSSSGPNPLVGGTNEHICFTDANAVGRITCWHEHY